MTLFRMSGTTYTPSYSVDLISLPAPKPAPVAKPVPVVKTAPKEVKKQSQPAETKPAKPTAAPPPLETLEELKPSGGDEAARLERRKKIEGLEMEARRLYESFSSEENITTEDRTLPDETDAVGPPVANAPTGGNATPSNIKFRAYYDRIWAQIRSSWVLPEGVTSRVSLVTDIRIRIAPNGEIEQSWIEKKSGNDYYDQSALRAIRKANPLPPLPDELSGGPHVVGLNFNSQKRK